MNNEAYLDGYLCKEAGSTSDRIAAKYGTKDFKEKYRAKLKAGGTSQQAAKAGMAKIITPPVVNASTPVTPDAHKILATKLKEMSNLGQDTYKQIRTPAIRDKYVADTLANIRSKGPRQTPSWLNEEMRKGNLSIANEAQLRADYMNTPEYIKKWSAGEKMFNDKMQEFNAPAVKQKVPPIQQTPAGNILAGNTQI